MTLKSVDFPAPFGPITEKIAPRSTVRLTWESAASAPNRLETSCTSRTGPLALTDRRSRGSPPRADPAQARGAPGDRAA